MKHDVYWGTHGCHLPKGHIGMCMCDCAWQEDGSLAPKEDEDGVLNVGAWPWYGEITRFYGDDVAPHRLVKGI